MPKIPIAGPSITQKEIDYVADAVAHAWYGDAGMYHARFERAFADYLGVKHAVALPSCTSAIHLALLAMGVGPGDEVIVPEITWIATSAPITYVGATPVFADIDPRSWCLSATTFESCITPRTKAVIPVDLYGNMPDMDAIGEVARAKGISVLEDAAQAVGATYQGRKAGSLGDVGVFSFHGSKTLTTGEGGMLVSDNDAMVERVQILRDHGRVPGDKAFFNREIAFKYKMSSMQAALGLAQLERIDELIAKKREIFAWYQSEMADVDLVTLNDEAAGTRNVYWMVTVILADSLRITAEEMGRQLAERGIDTRPFFHPLSSLPAYRDHPQASEAALQNETAYSLSPRGLNLPSALNLAREDVRFVCESLKEILRDAGRTSI